MHLLCTASSDLVAKLLSFLFKVSIFLELNY